ncbi:MAG: glycosyltransferase [Acidimicrobiales bacterium]
MSEPAVSRPAASGSAADLVSVLVPTFNGERYLAEALRSVASQTYQNLEIVICDDGSTDASPAIAVAFAAEDPRIRLHRNGDRLGPVGNFGRCLALASGPYVKYLMQDDVLEPHAVERLLVALSGADDIVLATSRRRLIDEHGGALPDRPEVRPPYDRDAVVEGLSLGNLVLEENLNLIGEPSAVLFRRSMLGDDEPFALEGTPYRYLADLALWLPLLARGRAAYLVEPLTRFRHHEGQDSRVRGNMIVSVLEWHRLHREARALGFLASDRSWERARRRWLEHAPFFFRFCSGMPDADRLFRAIVAANTDLVRLSKEGNRRQRVRTVLGAATSCVHAALLFPVAGLGADRAHRLRAGRRRRRARPSRR